MFPDHHLPSTIERELRPDRRPLPRASEIRLRVKRATSPKGA
ncbi:MAG TPA: hypothetical protein VE088_10430 [Gaiellaceae bacterium]|jgi:hypothetical protein|nr:hypothetical protein [Gaiellaceae bacterium]